MNCEETRKLLSAYIDGELDDARAVEEHLEGCSACAQECESLRKLSGLLKTLPEPELTASPSEATVKQLRRARVANRLRVVGSVIAAAAVVLMAVSLYTERQRRSATDFLHSQSLATQEESGEPSAVGRPADAATKDASPPTAGRKVVAANRSTPESDSAAVRRAAGPDSADRTEKAKARSGRADARAGTAKEAYDDAAAATVQVEQDREQPSIEPQRAEAGQSVQPFAGTTELETGADAERAPGAVWAEKRAAGAADKVAAAEAQPTPAPPRRIVDQKADGREAERFRSPSAERAQPTGPPLQEEKKLAESLRSEPVAAKGTSIRTGDLEYARREEAGGREAAEQAVAAPMAGVAGKDLAYDRKKRQTEAEWGAADADLHVKTQPAATPKAAMQAQPLAGSAAGPGTGSRQETQARADRSAGFQQANNIFVIEYADADALDALLSRIRKADPEAMIEREGATYLVLTKLSLSWIQTSNAKLISGKQLAVRVLTQQKADQAVPAENLLRIQPAQAEQTTK